MGSTKENPPPKGQGINVVWRCLLQVACAGQLEIGGGEPLGAAGMSCEVGIGGNAIGDGVTSDLDVVDADDRPAVTLVGLSHRIRLHRLIDDELHAHDFEGGLADTLCFA